MDEINRYLNTLSEIMEIAIIGGGITGLTTALILKKKGIPCQVYEKASVLNEVGAGIWLQPNAMKVLDFLDLGDTIRAAGMPLNQVEITTSDLQPIQKTNAAFSADDITTNITSIHRARLQKILFTALPPESVHLGQEYVSHKSNNEKVVIDFSSKKVEADLVLGADGINSKLRKNLFPSQVRYSGQTCWRGISKIELSKEMQEKGREIWGNDIRFGFANISPSEVYWFAVAKAPINEKDQALHRKAKLLNSYKSFHPVIVEIIENTPSDKIIRNDINDLKRLDTWHQENICLLGDAAHATTPNMGQGAGQGIEDAYYIGKYLEENCSASAFGQFERARRKKVDYVVKNSWIFGKIAHNNIGRPIMKLVMKFTPQSVLLKQMHKIYAVDGLT